MENKKNISGLSDIETLLKKNNLKYAEHWNPTLTSQFRENLSNGELSDLPEPTRTQIVYSLQYLQFLKTLIDDIKMHSIVEAELYKTFLITSVSIIEAILYHIVKKNFEAGKIEKKYHSSIAKIEEEVKIMENKSIIDGEERKIKLAFINELDNPEWFEDVKLYKLINVAKNSHLGICNSNGYNTLHELREMRNKIHLTIDEISDTDYKIFNKKCYYLSRESLYCILTHEKFEVSNPELFEFIKLSEKEANFDPLKKKWGRK